MCRVLSHVMWLLAIGLIAASAVSPAQAQEASPMPTSPWVTLPSIPLARSELAAAVIGTRIYVVGGFGGGERVDRFETTTGIWQQVADLPEAVHHAGVAALDGRIYVAGGYRIEGMTELAAVWSYDPASDIWEQRANLPTARGALGLAAVGGKLYAIGGARGHLGGPVTGAVEEYDPATNRWEPRAEMLTPREHLAVVSADGLVFAVGGRANGDERDLFAAANEVYDPVANQWQARAALPVPRGGLSGVFVAGNVVVLGGERGSMAFADADAYDISTDRWTVLPSMALARHGLASAAVGHVIYAITGSTLAGDIRNTPVVAALEVSHSLGAATPTADSHLVAWHVSCGEIFAG